MLVIATFKHSAYLELAIITLEQLGISKEHFIVAPLDKQVRDKEISNYSIIHNDGKSQYDKLFVFGTILMLIGAIYGFKLAWGPIIWAMIGLISGGLIGYILDIFIRKKPLMKKDSSFSEVVVLVDCQKSQTERVEQILWSHQAMGVAKISGYSEEVKVNSLTD